MSEKGASAIRPENLVPDKWREQVEINITKKREAKNRSGITVRYPGRDEEEGVATFEECEFGGLLVLPRSQIGSVEATRSR